MEFDLTSLPQALRGLCRDIDMPEEVTEAVAEFSQSLDWAALASALSQLSTPGSWNEGLTALRDSLGEDPRGLKILTCCLRQALNVWETYEDLGISREIFNATMACFSRFVGEHMVSFGCYGFDRAWWTVRQLSTRLFRIGLLEYELKEEAGAIGLHIPSGARLRQEALRSSYLEARALIARCFPRYAQADISCGSWLLSPTLEKLLPPDSNILRFQRSFRLVPQGTGDSYLLWVFRRMDLPTEQLPEDTSLQRALKAYLLSGGIWEEARGTLSQDPFLP